MSKVQIKCVVVNDCKSNFVLTSAEEVNVKDKIYAVGTKINATPSGKMRMNDIHINVEDRVIVEVDDTDVSRGRIIRRL